jgi:hypothetical protein
MTFQTLPFPGQSDLYYYDGSLHDSLEDCDSSDTWKYSDSLQNINNLSVGSLSVENQPISELDLPHFLKQNHQELTGLVQAQFKALIKIKFGYHRNFWSYIPDNLLHDYVTTLNQITNIVVNEFKSPESYDHILKVEKMLRGIEKHKIVFKSGSKKELKYDQFGARTNRLRTKNGTFPILSYEKDKRQNIIPANDYFLYLDYNGADVRVLLGLLDMEQPDYDVHEWNRVEAFGGIERKKAKKEFFHWLFSGKKHDVLDGRYDIIGLKKKHLKDGVILTPFGRRLVTEERKFVSYLVQSTSADIALEQDVKVHNFLKNKKSRVSMLIHDAIVVDLAHEDLNIIPDIIKVYSGTRFGDFMLTSEIGKDLGNTVKI